MTSMERLRAFGRRSAHAEAVDGDADMMKRFTTAMDADFHTPEALAALFDAVRLGNTALDAKGDVAAITAAFRTMAEVLGLDLSGEALDDVASEVATVARFVGGDTAAVHGGNSIGTDRRQTDGP